MDAIPPDNKTYLIDDRRDGRVVEKFKASFGAAKDLRQSQQDWQFFSPALLYLFGGFSDEHIARFFDESAVKFPIVFYRFDRSIFSGMQTAAGDSDWDHVLWAVPTEHWTEFEQYLISLVIVDHESRSTYGVGAQDIEIFDPLFADRNPVLPVTPPKIVVVVLGVSGSRTCVAMDKAKNNVLERPQVRRHRPQKHAVNYAEALFGGKNPTAANDEELI